MREKRLGCIWATDVLQGVLAVKQVDPESRGRFNLALRKEKRFREFYLGHVFRRPGWLWPLLSHLGGPQSQRHLGAGRIVFSTAEKIGQGSALEQVQLHQA